MAEAGLDLRAVQETLDWHDAPPEVGEVVQTSTEHELAITQLRALLVHVRALRAALREMLDLNYKWSPTREGESTRSSRAAEVLRGAQDQEGEPSQ